MAAELEGLLLAGEELAPGALEALAIRRAEGVRASLVSAGLAESRIEIGVPAERPDLAGDLLRLPFELLPGARAATQN